METEIKLAIAPRAAARLRTHPALAGAKGVTTRLHSAYFDTPAYELLRAGVALRLRRVGRRWVQTLKARADAGGMLSQRPEWEAVVLGGRPNLTLLPPEAQALLPEGVAGRIVPVFETVFRRTTWQVEREASRIEVALDRGEVRAAGRTMPIAEVELELKAGELTDLFDLAGALLGDLPLHLEPRSKAQRGYQLAGALAATPVKASVPDLDPQAPAGRAFVAIARACMAHFEANLPGYLEAEAPDPEYVHQMRVSMRRLRAVAGLTRFLDMSAPAWVEELKWLMGELSRARDWDVFATQILPRVSAHLAPCPSLDAVAQVSRRLRQAANARARAALAGTRLATLWLELGRSLAGFPDTRLAAGAWAQAALERRYRRLRRLGSRLSELDPAERHAMRIAGKKLRYAAEFFAALHPKAARRFIDRLAHLQDVLGSLNDLAVTAGLLEEVKGAGGQAVLEGAGLVAGFLASEQELRLTELKRAWRDFLHTPPYWR